MTGAPETRAAPGGAARRPAGRDARHADRDRVAAALRERAERDPVLAGFGLEVAPLGTADALAAAPDPAAAAPPGPGHRAVVAVHLGERSLIAAVVPVRGDAPCPHCLAVRWQKLRPNHQRTALEQGSGLHALAPDPLLTPFALDTFGDLVAALVRRAAPGEGGAAPRPGMLDVHELRTDTLRVRAHTLTRDPDCPRCAPADGPPPPADGAEAVPRHAPKPHPDVYRGTPVAAMALPLDALTGPLCGILGPDALPVLDSTTTAPVTGRIAVRDGPALLDVHWSGHSAVHGHSTVLAVCEGLERCAGLRPHRGPGRVAASRAELAAQGAAAADPEECGVLAADSPALAAGFAAYSPHTRVPWVPGYSLRDRAPVLVPEQFVSYTVNDGWPRFAAESSSGSAGGATLTEAVLHALLERVERDAFLIAWHGRARLPEIDPAGHVGPETRHMIARLALIGYDVRFFDTRIDLPLPVVTAVAVGRAGSGGTGGALVSAGAGLDPRQALHTALLEVASNLPGLAERTEARLPELRAMAADFTRVREMRDHAALFGLPEMAPHLEPLLGEPRAVPMPELYAQWDRDRPRGLDLADDLRFCSEVLADRGFDTVAVDQTGPDQHRVGLRTARVLVPGLVPIDFGWDRQRVLDMPRTRTALRDAGLHTAALARSELHHVPHPFM